MGSSVIFLLQEVLLLCAGEGPVVHVHPSELDFGNIPVLTDVPRTLRLSNQALIAAPFQVTMVSIGDPVTASGHMPDGGRGPAGSQSVAASSGTRDPRCAGGLFLFNGLSKDKCSYNREEAKQHNG